MELTYLTPIVIGKKHIGLVDEEDILGEQDFADTPGSFRTESINRRTLEDYPKTTKLITEAIREYTKEIMGIQEETELQIMNSWLNSYSKGEYLKPHYHTNSIVTCVYILECPLNNTSQLAVEDPTVRTNERAYRDERTQYTEYTLQVKPIEASQGDIIIMPSNLIHSVSEQTNDATRVTLSCNVNYHGLIRERGVAGHMIIAPLDERSIIF